jgi:GT2 family glycosyltransferase
MASVDVSIVVVHRNSYARLRRCLRSILENTVDLRFEIVVIDNGSTDESVASTEREFPGVFVVPVGRNLGYGRGNNRGYERTSGKYVLFLNDDTVLRNNAVGAMFSFAEEHPELRIGAIGALLESRQGSPSHSFGRFPHPLSQASIILTNLGLLKWELNVTASARRSSKRWFPVDFVTGAAFFVPRHVFAELKGFDEEFFLYFEETELQHRMALAGYGRYVIEGPRILHYGGGGGARSNWTRIETYRGLFLYHRKTRNRVMFLVFCMIALAFICAHIFNPAFTARENIEFIRSALSALFMPSRASQHASD